MSCQAYVALRLVVWYASDAEADALPLVERDPVEMVEVREE